MRNTERTAVSLATRVATILSLVAIPIVTRGQTTGMASTPLALTPLEQVWYSGRDDGTHYRLDFTRPDRCACVRRSVGQGPGWEGTANFTDPATGTLLLYSDSYTVFNGRTHKALDNGTGLNGNGDICDPVQITPAPGGTRDLFYIFTNNNGNIYYSIADLAAQPNKPNGRVTVKNQGPLATNTGETQGMVPHADGRAIWLLVYNTGATVDAYLVDGPSGVNAKPVSSPTGLGGLGWASIVHSPDYNTLALGNSAYGIAIGKIDRATGNISNVQLRVKGSDVGYSSAFSPDGTKLYYARGSAGWSGTPYQFDLTTGVETQLYPSANGFGGPKLAPDGRVYWTGSGKDALSVVQNPNAAGTEVIFLQNDLYLNGGRGSFNLPRQTIAYTAYAYGVWSVTAVSVPAQQAWVDTGVDLNAGDALTISADGTWTISSGGTPVGPDGFPGPPPVVPLSTANLAALIGKVGDAIFLVGSAYNNKTSPGTGRLYLQINDNPLADNSGALNVKVGHY